MRGMLMCTGSRKHLTAWLGQIAMWLIVLAPVVSQLVAFAPAVVVHHHGRVISRGPVR
jgi:hypothetical protein